MRRIIEELVEKRKEKQAQLKETFLSLARLLKKRGFLSTLFNTNKKALDETLLQLNDNLNDLITIQDKEWDAYSNNHSTMVFKSLQWKIEKLEAEYSNVKTLLTNFITLETSLDHLITAINDKTAVIRADDTGRTDLTTKLLDFKAELSVYRYADFEQRFRGSEEKVREKLRGYLPIFANTDDILDIGCGRGEFIELIQATGKKATGIDMSPSMLQLAQEKGLTCSLSDALAHLKQLPDACLGGIFSAQVIEHLEPDYLRDLVIEGRRVLRTGTPMVLETVNPLSIFALSNIYFLDVTHKKPLHPEFMRYLVESSGFFDVAIIYPEELLNEQLEGIAPQNTLAREFNSNVDKLNKLLYSSPVYAVTGIKK